MSKKSRRSSNQCHAKFSIFIYIFICGVREGKRDNVSLFAVKDFRTDYPLLQLQSWQGKSDRPCLLSSLQVSSRISNLSPTKYTFSPFILFIIIIIT
jgi:hypothetical protein